MCHRPVPSRLAPRARMYFTNRASACARTDSSATARSDAAFPDRSRPRASAPKRSRRWQRRSRGRLPCVPENSKRDRRFRALRRRRGAVPPALAPCSPASCSLAGCSRQPPRPRVHVAPAPPRRSRSALRLVRRRARRRALLRRRRRSGRRCARRGGDPTADLADARPALDRPLRPATPSASCRRSSSARRRSPPASGTCSPTRTAASTSPTYFELRGLASTPRAGEVERFGAPALGLNELALGPDGQLLVTRYGFGARQPTAALVVLDAERRAPRGARAARARPATRIAREERRLRPAAPRDLGEHRPDPADGAGRGAPRRARARRGRPRAAALRDARAPVLDVRAGRRPGWFAEASEAPACGCASARRAGLALTGCRAARRRLRPGPHDFVQELRAEAGGSARGDALERARPRRRSRRARVRGPRRCPGRRRRALLHGRARRRRASARRAAATSRSSARDLPDGAFGPRYPAPPCTPNADSASSSAMGPGRRGDRAGRAARHALRRHRVPVPPGQRLPLPDRLRPPARGGGAPHRRRPGLHALRRAARPRRRDLDRLPAGRRGRGRRLRRRRGVPARRAPRREAAGAARAARSASSTCSAATRSSTRRIVEILDEMRAALARRAACRRRRSSIRARSLHEMRLRKEPEELEMMRRAAAISAEAHREAARLARGGPLRVRARGRARLHRSAAAAARGRPTRASSAAGATRPILHYIANDQPLTRRRARADRRRLRARRLRRRRDAHLPGGRPLQRRARARRLRGRCSSAQLAALERWRSRARRCRRSTAPRCASSSRAWSSSACSRATSTS